MAWEQAAFYLWGAYLPSGGALFLYGFLCLLHRRKLRALEQALEAAQERDENAP